MKKNKEVKKDTIKIWVYGTLKVGGRFAKGFDNKRLSVIKAVTKGVMYNVGYFPAVIFDSENILHGELHEYAKTKQIIKRFDAIECFYGDYDRYYLYNRVIIEVVTSEGTTEQCYAYAFNRDIKNLKKITTGIWEI
jgi:gamma-glutamylcyclotransferase (GGCT)/AIG2-like uncharacterized protein YtfP